MRLPQYAHENHRHRLFLLRSDVRIEICLIQSNPSHKSPVRHCDLTFNKLVGELPRDTIRREFTFLSGNLLTGTVQDSFIQSNTHLYVPKLHHWILLFEY
ncbi:hypothetical protein DKX38_017307 [Salix brachista]|uniref:Uncharacterized protein n=1 Tax=Salix brachista TaxID=2182728 RepID=A0A5N5KVR0_9ROSI|nr:hypothetical protein DKX38_017307 [Salix brachista]